MASSFAIIMKPNLILLFVHSIAFGANPPIELSKNQDGLAIEISKMPIPSGGKLDGATREDEGIIQLRVVAPEQSKTSKPQVIPLRFAPESQVGDVPCVWNRKGTCAAFIMSCYEARGDDHSRLFVADVKVGQLELLALPDVVTHIASIRKDVANLEIDWSDKCFGWIDEDLLIVHFEGSCELAADVGGSESREVSGYAVFCVTPEKKMVIREIISLRIQG